MQGSGVGVKPYPTCRVQGQKHTLHILGKCVGFQNPTLHVGQGRVCQISEIPQNHPRGVSLCSHPWRTRGSKTVHLYASFLDVGLQGRVGILCRVLVQGSKPYPTLQGIVGSAISGRSHLQGRVWYKTIHVGCRVGFV